MVADWVLLALIATLPIMKPAVSYPVVLPDLLFLLLIAVLGIELLSRRRWVKWRRCNWILLLYVASLTPSLFASENVSVSLLKVAENLYLVTLAGITSFLIDSELKLRRAITTWLAATAIMVFLAPLSVAAFYLSVGSSLLGYTSYDFGSLPPGNYPRLALSFINANMMCNYLTASLGMLLVAGWCGWLRRVTFVLLLCGILFAALTSISPGLGGIALLGGTWIWLVLRRGQPLFARSALISAVAMALLFAAALAVTPVIYPGAPVVLRLPGTAVLVAPSGRFLTWTSALHEFLRHPLVGHGMGIDAAAVTYPRPDGVVEHLTDAHNMFLSIAAQAGAVGILGVAVVIALAVRLTGRLQLGKSCASTLKLGLGITFLDVFVYQGLGGSFEDTRHIWVLLGMLIAASRLGVSPSDGNNRRAVEPSPC